MKAFLSILWIAAVASERTYFQWSNHDGVQVGSKYIYFSVPTGDKPIPKTFNEATAACEASGGELAYPVDSIENDAIMQFLTEHFQGNVEEVEEGLGAWIGVHMNDTGHFVYADGTEATFVPVDFFSRLVADFDICMSINHGKVFNEELADFEDTLVWDEGFCRRHKMPLCMVDLADEVNCMLFGDLITSEVIESSCDGYSRCIEGNYTEFMCEGGMRFSVNGSDFGGECIDAREVPECDIDECEMWDDEMFATNHTCPMNSVNCTNEIGTHTCECDTGLRFNDSDSYWDYDTWSCDDIDECVEGTHDCNDDSDCVNTFGSFWCHCHEGFYYEDLSEDGECVDFDECLDGVHYYDTEWPPQLLGDPENFMSNDTWEMVDACHPDGFCSNTIGAFNCTCNEGFRMNATDMWTCEDIDECAEGIDECHDDSWCNNTYGSYECYCNEGYYGDGFECVDSDECGELGEAGVVNNVTDGLFMSHECSDQGFCTNTIGAYNCTCDDGFYGSGWNCTDGNECGDEDMGTTDGIDDFYFGTHECNPEALCVNSFGSYNCTCNEGFFGDGFNCSDSNECGDMPIVTTAGVEDPIFESHMCSTEGTCTNTWGEYNCTCNEGFYGDGFNCTDGNECGDAPIGMAAGVEDHYFEDHECHIEATCANTFGAYNCSCNLGWEGDGWNCTDIDECRDEDMRMAAWDEVIGGYDFCSPDAFCTNTPGGYNCTCNEGYDGNGFNCTDIDECALGIDECDLEGDRAWCNNTIGSYECYCNDGYYGDGFGCTNSDECGAICDMEECGHVCAEAGVQGEECMYACWTECADPNEVGMYMNESDVWYATNQCSELGVCNDTVGSYDCMCDWGFEGDGFNCTDIDECDVGSAMCHEDADCENEFGGYNCTCATGYFGDGFNCTDIDECLEEDSCHAEATCNNTIGSYECECNEGFFGDGFLECMDSDECGEADDAMWVSKTDEMNFWGYPIENMNMSDPLFLDNDCHDDAFCSNSYGAYNCTCNEGFRGDGFNCTDIDECLEGIDDCHADAACNNTYGSYECACNDGFYGDGFECIDSDECAEEDMAGEYMNITDELYNSHMCSENGYCTNTIGGYNCTCNDGFFGEGKCCMNSDECEIGTVMDDQFADYSACMADKGVEWNETAPADGFFGSHECSEFASCSDLFGAYNCTCDLGYIGDGWNCTEVDECVAKIDALRIAAPPELVGTLHYCHDDAFCTNTPGGYNCTCNEGFEGDGFDHPGLECFDIDECALGIHMCDVEMDRAWCNNTYGSYECFCNDGYYGDGYGCTNSDECADTCDSELTCEYDCMDVGVQGESCAYACNTDCDGPNEVGEFNNETDIWFATNQCSEQGVCNDTIGSYDCMCDWGYEGDGFNCTDIDECMTGDNMCHDDAICENLDGGYNCTCEVGYFGDGFNCTDIDECLEDDACHEEAMCNNTVGGYECMCNDGFFGDGFLMCEDSDECADGAASMWVSTMNDVNSWGYPIMDMNISDPLYDGHECSAQGSCMNTYGGYNCTCNDGFYGDGFNCTDGNECGDMEMGISAGVDDFYWGTHECNDEATCTNTFGGYNCSCDDGFYGDGFNCSDSNECGDMPIGMAAGVEDPIFDSHMCSSEASCTNTWGGYNCTCDFGFYGDGFNCSDGNECGDGIQGMAAGVMDTYFAAHECDVNAACANTFGAYNCTCDLGYKGDGWNCTEVDECVKKITEMRAMAPPHLVGTYHYCDDNAYCSNTAGGYNCTCNDGWVGDGFNCTDFDECFAPRIAANDDQIGHFQECSDDAICTNTPGGYNCTCMDGYAGDGFNCTDVDECAEGIDECHENAWCNNTIGAYECYCEDGFYGDGFECADSDECGDFDQGTVNNVTDGMWNEHECHEEAFCTNFFGSYNCTCNEGWQGDGFNCTDVDECDEGLDECSEDGTCSNTIGSYECTCNEGYFGDGFICADSDECAEGDEAMTVMNVTDPLYDMHECSDDGFCTNTIGAYNCTCNEGYRGNGWNCTDIDECAEDLDECHEEATCNNTIGFYDCACNEGFFGDGWVCADSDECAEDEEAMVVANVTDPLYSEHMCHVEAFCMNTYGAYNCTCMEGFEGDGFNCTDINECEEGTDDCDQNAECTNTYGSWECSCNHGWYGDGVECVDSDECGDGDAADVFLNVTDPLWGVNDCHDDAFCSNGLGGYNCTCMDGYEGDGFNCTDYDECSAEMRMAASDDQIGMPDQCDDNAMCMNTVGGYNCTCMQGFEGDGFNCTDVDECELPRIAASGDQIGEIDQCSMEAECTNTFGGYNCTCNDGYEGDGFNCTDIDECDLEIDDCHDDATCHNYAGSYNCSCNEGFFGDGYVCGDSNECGDLEVAIVTTMEEFGDVMDIEDHAHASHECSVEASCANTYGAYNCTCDPGWEGDGFNCTDVDECTLGMRVAADGDIVGMPHMCDENAICSNTPGGYNCTCNDGYSGDGFNCTDVDECMEGIDECHEQATCDNLDGSYNCTCNDGFYGTGWCCLDSDECGFGDVLDGQIDEWDSCITAMHDGVAELSADPMFADQECHADASCANTYGGYNCTCDDGYSGDGFDCEDIDECAEGLDNCDDNASCNNTVPFFECFCDEGYEGNGTEGNCHDIDECDLGTHQCHDNAWCNNTVGAYECYCNDGYFGDGMDCADSDECAYDDCSMQCLADHDMCQDAGVAGDSCTFMCKLMCAETEQMSLNNVTDDGWGSNECSDVGTCTNTDGGYNCTCDWGYEGDGFDCNDIDECAGDNECDVNADCTNDIGMYNCTCMDGYSGDGFNCTDIDECDLELDECHDNAMCTNNVGSYDCECMDGYYGDGFDCADSDECGYSDCEYSCSMGACEDAGLAGEECAAMCATTCATNEQGELNNVTDALYGSHACSADGECMNTDGGYNCSCSWGYEGDGFDCTDVDECAIGADMCDDNAACENDIGMYNCTCMDGFTGDGFNCTDIDECDMELDECDDNASCTNTVPGYNCTCNEGYEGDGFTCANVDECATETDECSEFADCTDTEGSYNCTCILGYTGDGFTCEEVDECTKKITELRSMAPDHLIGEFSYCDDNAFCTNTPGGYNCTCNEGFWGDGFNCTDANECGDGVVGVDDVDENGYTDTMWGTHQCSEFGTCSNTPGNYTCECIEGYEGDGFTCENMDECAAELDQCDDNASCEDADPGYNCTCNPGYSGDGFTCEDVDECLLETDNCDDNAACTNTVGSFTCECNAGYQDNSCPDGWEGNFGLCHKFVDSAVPYADAEADCNAQGAHVAYITSEAHNTYLNQFVGGSTAWMGYTERLENGKWRWRDVNGDRFPDGYLNWHPNNPNNPETETCMHLTGVGRWKNNVCTISRTYICQMDATDPGTSCFDVNECEETGAEELCTDNAACVNFDGGYLCQCADGYQGDGNPGGECIDVDECLIPALSGCAENSVCNNTDGSYTCDCLDGFEGDGFKKCRDIHECFLEIDNCHDNALCENTIGSFECSCNTGYTGPGEECFDVEECIKEEDDCDGNAVCINTDGAYECECNSGYTGDGHTADGGSGCQDDDECADGTAVCQEFASCSNTDGGYDCVCDDGFWPMSGTCFDIDECTIPVLNDCDIAGGATCNNVPGGYFCSCPDGFGGTGTSGDPCTDTLGSCDPFALEGYVANDCSGTVENTECAVTCDNDNHYYDNNDGDVPDYNVKCTCTGDRDDIANLVCGWENVNPASTCALCPALSEITWFGDHTNDIKVQGVDGQLVDSRVEANFAVDADWSEYTVYLLLPGDWSNARIFTWVFDIDIIEVEEDETSTIVVLKQNANSPVLTSDWSQFFVGFDNIQSFIDSGVAADYKIAVVPSITQDAQCVMGHVPVSPEESVSRSMPRKMARKHARQAARKAAGGN